MTIREQLGYQDPGDLGELTKEMQAIREIYAPTLLTPLMATDIPFYDEGSGLGVKAWNVLQISRVSGALRFFINARLLGCQPSLVDILHNTCVYRIASIR
jgi:hypothetical protein